MNRWLTCIAAGLVVAAALTLPADSARGADEARLDKAVQAVLAWNYGDNAGELNYLAGEVVQAARSADAKAAMERRILTALSAAKTRPSRDFFCRQLVFVGSEASVEALAKLLTDAESSHIARYALERLPGKAADEALRDALGKVDEKLRVGMVFSLGRRADAAAAGAIIKLLGSDNDDLVVASLVAPSRIDSAEAVAAVAKARGAVKANLRPAATGAYLDCAKRLAAAGRTAAAAAIYRKLYAVGEPSMCRVAALGGLISVEGAKATSLAIAALGDKDPKVREVAVPTLRDVPGAGVTAAIAAELGRQDASVRPLLLLVLADRADPAALPAVTRATSDRAEPVRLAAIEALGKLGDDSSVPLLAKAAAGGGEAQKVARASLHRLQGKKVNAALVAQLRSSVPAVRAEAVRALGARTATERMDDVLKTTGDKDPAVAAEALRSARVLAGAEHVGVLVKFLVSVTDEKVRAEAERTVLAAARQIPAGKSPVAALLAAMKSAGTGEVKASLIRVMGQVGHADAMKTLVAAAADRDAAVKDAAIRALADWPTAAPAKTLSAIAADTSASQVHRVLALRGYVGMIHKQEDAGDDQILADYARAMGMASRPQEKQLVLSKLATLRHAGALEMAKRYREDPALKAAASAAVAKITKLMAAPAKVTASHNMEKVGNAIDGDAKTRWDTGGSMQGGEWFKIELDSVQLISAVVLDTRGSSGDYPRGYEVYISKSSLGQGKLVAKGKGRTVLEIKLRKPVEGKTVKIVQTGSTGGTFWSIHEIKVKAAPVP